MENLEEVNNMDALAELFPELEDMQWVEPGIGASENAEGEQRNLLDGNNGSGGDPVQVPVTGSSEPTAEDAEPKVDWTIDDLLSDPVDQGQGRGRRGKKSSAKGSRGKAQVPKLKGKGRKSGGRKPASGAKAPSGATEDLAVPENDKRDERYLIQRAKNTEASQRCRAKKRQQDLERVEYIRWQANKIRELEEILKHEKNVNGVLEDVLKTMPGSNPEPQPNPKQQKQRKRKR